MAVSQLVQSRAAAESVNAGSTVYVGLGYGTIESGATESGAATPCHEAGSFDKVFLRISANSLSGNCVVTLRKNSGDTPVTFTISSGSTGIQADNTNSASFSAGDLWALEIEAAAGTGSISFTMMGARFTPDTSGDCVSFLGVHSTSEDIVSTPSTTWYVPLNGTRGVTTNEAEAQCLIPVAGSLRKLWVRTGTNSWSGTVSITVRVNGSSQAALQVDITAAGVQTVSDTTGSVSVAAGDLVNFAVTTDGGSGDFPLDAIGVCFVSTASKFLFINQGINGDSRAADSYFCIAGEEAGTATDAALELEPQFDFTVSELAFRVYSISSPTANGNTLYVRKNGSNTLLRGRFSQATGVFRDVVDTVALTGGSDSIDLYLDHVSGTTIRIDMIVLVGDSTGGGGGGTPESPAFAPDATTNGGGFTTTSPHTFTHAPGVEAPTGAIVLIAQNDATDRITGVTYGGTAMTRLPTNGIAQDSSGEPVAAYCYVLYSSVPLVDATVSISHDGNSVAKHAACVTLKGGANTETAASGKIESDTATPVVALDSGAEEAVRVYVCASGMNSPTGFGENSGFAAIADVDFGTTSATFGYQSSAASGSVNTGPTAIEANDVALIALAVAEVAAGQNIAVGQVTETDTAQAIAWAPKERLLGQISESDVAQSVTWSPKHRLVAQISESDIAQALTRVKTRTVAQVSETDVAQAVVRLKALLLGQVTETDLAQGMGRLKTRTVGQVSETDTAQAVTAGGQVVSVDQAVESDLAQVVLWAPKHRLVVTALESDLAQVVAHLKTKLVGQVLETDAAQAIARVKAEQIGQVTETDLAQAIQRGLMVAQVFETDVAQPITLVGGVAILGYVFDVPARRREFNAPARKREFAVRRN